jgi:type IV pilus assembly protein PilY1
MRIPLEIPSSATNWSGTYFLPDPTVGEDPGAPKGFVSDPITIDFDINPSKNAEYISDAVYFGTVEGKFLFDPETTLPFWAGGGQMLRLVMNKDGHTIRTDDFQNPNLWAIKPLLNLSGEVELLDDDDDDNTNPIVDRNPSIPGNPIQPITGAASVGTDGYYYWIYFGTGRYFDDADRTDTTQQSFYGIKEPMSISETSTKLTWDEVELTGVGSYALGRKGLLQVDKILVQESDSGDSQLACRNDNGTVTAANYSCLPSGLASGGALFNELETYIAGKGSCDSTADNCVDGWYRNFYPYSNRERNLGMPTLLGGLVTFTT